MAYISKTEKKRGMTLIETLAVISVFIIVIVTLTASVMYFYRANSNLIEQAYALSSARKGIEFMAREIREATYSDEGSFPVISMSGNSFYFYSDIDQDSNIERVRYFLSGTDLKKGMTKAVGDPPVYNDVDEVITFVSDNVRNTAQGQVLFEFYDSNGAQITSYNDVLDVVYLRAYLIVNVNPSRLPNEFTLRTSAAIRNLKINL